MHPAAVAASGGPALRTKWSRLYLRATQRAAMEAMKKGMFQLEIDRQQGKITPKSTARPRPRWTDHQARPGAQR